MRYDSLSPLFDMDQLVKTIAKHGGLFSAQPPIDDMYYWIFKLKDGNIIYSNFPMATIYNQIDRPKSKKPIDCDYSCSKCLNDKCFSRRENYKHVPDKIL